MVFQHFMLADNLTVWENIVLGDEPGSRFRMDVGAARKRIRELGRNYGLDVDPDELVAELGVGDKQRAEIIKVLYRNARIIILDEPTAVLVPQEVDELFDYLRGLVARGRRRSSSSRTSWTRCSGGRRDHRDPRRAHGGRGAALRGHGAATWPSSWWAASCRSPTPRESTVTDRGRVAR